ncbi:TonB-dependent receptor [Nitrospirillum sp. BR 11752]|uniref:TonB-dependent receptor n=1 Tax=Nitrospirillum sp. BR 11752 TaxID=3104293 RepID=UPI002EA74CE5|nr:TonB-dependent receptor [Nitrospirillum sp. BR 11752]
MKVRGFRNAVIAGLAVAAPSALAQTEITITAPPPEATRLDDRTVYDLANNLQAKGGGSVADVLTTLPAVSVDPAGKVSVRGAAVTVMVDGKPSPALRGLPLATALQSMPANTIAKIEVITDPGPEFRGDAGIVINLVTRKPRTPTAKADLGAGIGPQGRRSGSAAGSFGVGAWSFSGSADVRDDIRYDLLYIDRTAKNADGSAAGRLVEHRATFVPYTNTTGVLTVSYAASDHDALSLGGEGALRHRPRQYRDDLGLYDPDGGVTGRSVTQDRAPQHFDHASLTGDYVRKGVIGGDTLTLKASHEDHETLRDQTDDQLFQVPTAVEDIYRQRHTERELIDTISGDYVLPLPREEQLKLGFEVESDRVQSAYQAGAVGDAAVGDPGAGGFGATPAARFGLNRTLSAGYASYQRLLGPWLVKSGLRVESMATRFLAAAQGMPDSSDLRWLPSLSLGRDLSPESRLTFSYTRRIDRPTTEQLNPLQTIVGATTILGNTGLRPSRTDSVEAGYTYTAAKVTVSGTLYARRLTDDIVDYRYAAAPVDTVLVSTVENAGGGTSAGLDLAVDFHLGPDWAISLSSDLSHLRETMPIAGGPIGGENYTGALFTHLTKVNLTWTPAEGDRLQLQAQLHGRSLETGGTRSGYQSVTLSYSHDVTSRLKAIVTANDVFNGVRRVTWIDTPQYRERSELAVPGQIVYLRLTYKLGGGDTAGP